jgi:hypothetical protein
MHTSPQDRIRHLRLARALAGSEVEGLRLIEEIKSVSKLGHHHAEMADHGEDVDVHTLDHAFRVIEQHAKRAQQRYSALLQVLYEFLNDYEVDEFTKDDADEAAPEEHPTTRKTPRRTRS